jgi:hypothetical protein
MSATNSMTMEQDHGKMSTSESPTAKMSTSDLPTVNVDKMTKMTKPSTFDNLIGFSADANIALCTRLVRLGKDRLISYVYI